MSIGLLIFSIIMFISPFNILKLFKLNNYRGYLFGLFSFLASLVLGVGLGILFGIIFVMIFNSLSLRDAFMIIYIIILVGIFTCIYFFHLLFIKKIKDENNNAVIFMYLSGYFLVTAIIAFFNSLDVNLFKNFGFSRNFYENFNLIMNYLPYYIFLLNFGNCICIFFYLKQNNKFLFYLSIGIYSGEVILSIIGGLLESEIIIIGFSLLFPLFSLLIGIYLYSKYTQEDNLESVKETGYTNDSNLV